MKKIRIFIAGPKALEGERNALKALAHDLNTEYEDRSAHIQVKIKSYENFKDNQQEYNKFIEQEADLVIFVLEGKVGDKTREEFVKAATSYQEKQTPEIILFIRASEANSNESLDEIKSLVKTYLGDHYSEEYTSYADLKAKAKHRIDQYITPSFSLMQTARRWAISLLALLCLLFIGLFIWALFFRSPKAPTMNNHESFVHLDSMPILFAGGGSAANFIEQSYSRSTHNPICFATYPLGIYANMPSGNAWTLLAEEYNRYKKVDQHEDRLRFRTLCLSASRANLSELMKSCSSEDFNHEASIVECYIGEDILTAYVKKEARNVFPKQLRDTTRISASDLSALIKRPDILNIFSTAPNSGTCNMYRDHLPKSDSIDFEKLIKDDKVFIFNEASDYQVFKVSKNEGQDKDPNAGKPYVVLGGQYYFSYALKDLQAGQYYSLQVIDDTTRKPITKGIYLYFVAFNAEHDNIHTIIPAPILNFLKKTKIVQQDGWKAKVKGNKLVGRDIIIQLTERPKEFEVE